MYATVTFIEIQANQHLDNIVDQISRSHNEEVETQQGISRFDPNLQVLYSSTPIQYENDVK